MGIHRRQQWDSVGAGSLPTSDDTFGNGNNINTCPNVNGCMSNGHFVYFGASRLGIQGNSGHGIFFAAEPSPCGPEATPDARD